ncbi:tetratricopeptide repeat protein [Nanoarchaeota archaeon]
MNDLESSLLIASKVPEDWVPEYIGKIDELQARFAEYRRMLERHSSTMQKMVALATLPHYVDCLISSGQVDKGEKDFAEWTIIDSIEHRYSQMDSWHPLTRTAFALNDFLWEGRFTRLNSKGTCRLDRTIDAQLSERESVADCAGLTALYIALATREGIDVQMVFEDNGDSAHISALLKTPDFSIAFDPSDKYIIFEELTADLITPPLGIVTEIYSVRESLHLPMRPVDHRVLLAASAEVAKMTPSNAEEWYFLGSVFEITYEYERALFCFNQAVSLDTKEHYHNGRGCMLYAFGMREEARKDYERALEIDPTSECALNNLAEYHLDDGRMELAVSFIEQALILEPNVESYVLLKRIKENQGLDVTVEEGMIVGLQDGL